MAQVFPTPLTWPSRHMVVLLLIDVAMHSSLCKHTHQTITFLSSVFVCNGPFQLNLVRSRTRFVTKGNGLYNVLCCSTVTFLHSCQWMVLHFHSNSLILAMWRWTFGGVAKLVVGWTLVVACNERKPKVRHNVILRLLGANNSLVTDAEPRDGCNQNRVTP